MLAPLGVFRAKGTTRSGKTGHRLAIRTNWHLRSPAECCLLGCHRGPVAEDHAETPHRLYPGSSPGWASTTQNSVLAEIGHSPVQNKPLHLFPDAVRTAHLRSLSRAHDLRPQPRRLCAYIASLSKRAHTPDSGTSLAGDIHRRQEQSAHRREASSTPGNPTKFDLPPSLTHPRGLSDDVAGVRVKSMTILN